MSGFEETGLPCFPLSISAAREHTRVSVFDGRYRRVHAGIGPVELSLPRGLYTVRTELAGVIEETVVRLVEPKSVQSRQWVLPSAFPMLRSGVESGIPGTAELRSKYPKGPELGGKTARLFIFAWSNEREKEPGNFLRALKVLNGKRRLVADLADPNRTETEGGCSSFCADAQEGAYVLRLGGRQGREVPIYLSPGWETHVFVRHESRLRLEAMRVSMSRHGIGFHADDHISDILEIGLVGLQNGQSLVPSRILDELLWGKFENPILGLIGAHCLLVEDAQDRKRARIVLENLFKLLGDSPDLQALGILAGESASQGRRPPVTFPPMLRRGFEASIRWSIDHGEGGEEDGLIEKAATRAFSDSPWSTWKAFPYREESAGKFHKLSPVRIEDYEEPRIEPYRYRRAENPMRQMSWVENGLAEHLNRSPSGELGTDELKEFSRKNLVPFSVVQRAYRRMPAREVDVDEADRLAEVLEAIGKREFIGAPERRPCIELISHASLSRSDFAAIREFQLDVLKGVGVRLAVIGGGYGCSRVLFEIRADSAMEVREAGVRTLSLIQNPGFQDAAFGIGMRVAVTRNAPYLRVDLMTGLVEGDVNP